MVRKQFDTPWKLILEHFFKQLVEFFMPEAAAEIDWGKPHEFLDKELLAIQKKAKVGNKIADKLVKVFTKSGEEVWVILHVEVQGSKEKEFASRMFEYYYRIYDKHKVAIMSMAILTDENTNWRPNNFHRSLWGCDLNLLFPIVKLIDFKTQLATLKASSNPISKVVEAHLTALDVRGDNKLEFKNKLVLVKSLYTLGYTKEEVGLLYSFIDYLLALPEELEEEFIQNMREFEENNEMHYITSAERLGMKKGKLEGKLEGQQELLDMLLKSKFGQVPSAYLAKISDATPDQIQELCKKILTAKNIDELFN